MKSRHYDSYPIISFRGSRGSLQPSERTRSGNKVDSIGCGLLDRDCEPYYGNLVSTSGNAGKAWLRMRCHLPFRVVFLLSLLMCFQLDPTFAQMSIAKAPATTEKKASELKLTPEQKRGLRLLQSAQAEAVTLQPDMRAYVLMQVANGYQKLDPSKAAALLKEAFTASLSIEDMAPPSDDAECQSMQGCGIKPWLQSDILSSMRSLTDVEALLPHAQPRVRRQVTESLISQYVTKKNFERAKELITSLASQGDYPYDAAMQLMRAIPPTATSERVAVFVQALNAYRQQGETGYSSNGFEGMSGMVMRFWHDVPPELAVDAIDQTLEQAKDASAGPNKNGRTTWSGHGGTVTLSSVYQLRLFQLLPILQELDKPKAESLLRDNPDLRPLLDRFPEGFQAVELDYEFHPPKEGEAPIDNAGFFIGGDAPPSVIAKALEGQALERRKQLIVAESDTDPRQAVADAMSLPEVPLYPSQFSPRASALLRIAKKLGKKNPGVTKDALAEMRKSMSQTSVELQARGLSEAAEEYLEIGDKDGAHKTVEEALQLAEKLYAKDTDSGDPNQTFKGEWRSTQLWRRCVEITARFSPSVAEAIIANIKDPEIATFEKIYFASSLLGAPQKGFWV